MHAMWVTHGMMHACHVGDTWHYSCMQGGYVQPIKWGLVDEKRRRKRRKGERKRDRKEDLAASSSDFQCFDGRSSLEPRVKV